MTQIEIDNSPVPVPRLTLVKTINRWYRLQRLLELEAPKIIMDKEKELIEAGMAELKALCVEQGYMQSDAEREEFLKQLEQEPPMTDEEVEEEIRRIEEDD